MKTIAKKVTNKVCARECGVGQGTVTAVRKMLGIPSGVRKVFPHHIVGFMQTYPDFTTADATDMDHFKERHPGFKIPATYQSNANQPPKSDFQSRAA